MSCLSYTPGAWHVMVNTAGGVEIKVEPRQFAQGICILTTAAEMGLIPGGTMENARLIAAAPELLEAAELALQLLRNSGDRPNLEHKISNIIAKATGREGA